MIQPALVDHFAVIVMHFGCQVITITLVGHMIAFAISEERNPAMISHLNGHIPLMITCYAGIAGGNGDVGVPTASLMAARAAAVFAAVNVVVKAPASSFTAYIKFGVGVVVHAIGGSRRWQKKQCAE